VGKRLPGKIGRLCLFALAALGLVLAGVGLSWKMAGISSPALSPGVAQAGQQESEPVGCLGRLQPADGLIAVRLAVPDQVRRISVKEGDEVAENKELVVLASEDERRRDLDLAEARVQEAERLLKDVEAVGKSKVRLAELALDELEKLWPAKVKTQDLQLRLLKDQVHEAEANLKARRGEYRDSPRALERLELSVKQARTALEAAEVQREAAERQQELDVKLAQGKLEAARAALKQAQDEVLLESLRKQRDIAQERFDRTRVRAPCKGKVVRLLAHKGDLVGTEPILEIADTSRMVVVAEVDEARIAAVHAGDEATISSRVFNGEPLPRLHGTVVRKGTVVSRAGFAPLDPRQPRDLRTVEVIVELGPEDSSRAAGFIGHQVQVTISKPRTDSARAASGP
jgi:HlyD family secretion protein